MFRERRMISAFRFCFRFLSRCRAFFEHGRPIFRSRLERFAEENKLKCGVISCLFRLFSTSTVFVRRFPVKTNHFLRFTEAN